QVLQIVPKWNVMYYSFELENSPRDVINVINEYFNRTRHDEKNVILFIWMKFSYLYPTCYFWW
ncbi:MAG: hypothetical protein OEY17_08050, partial [Nitrosopumilus sp.]|nr:hypothetical protein [Nitrosopumilus sp.]